MLLLERPAESLGKAKQVSFGATLRRAIKSEFRSNKEFAKALGVSEGRISQIVNGPDAVDADTLERILKPFTSFALQYEIHEAWVREFAPLPSTESLLGDGIRTLEEVHRLSVAGLPTRALALAKQGRKHASDPMLWQDFTEHIVQIDLRLTKTSAALAEIKIMEERAHSGDEPAHLVTALWMKGLAARSLDFVDIGQLIGVHQAAAEFTQAWNPRGSHDQAFRQLRQAELERDYALHILVINDRNPVHRDLLDLALQSVQHSIERTKGSKAGLLGLEIRARIECAMGHYFKAEDTLDDLEGDGLDVSTETVEKSLLLRSRILAGRGEIEAASRGFSQVATYCFERMNLHHFRIADRELAKLRLGI